jgi:small subunit ribosomal protein S14
MKNQINRDKNRRILVKKLEKKRLCLLAIIHNQELPQSIRWKSVQKLNKLLQKGAVNQIRNRCVLTGRSRSVYRLFRISRIQFRDLGSNGLIPGIRKSSW